MFFFLHILIFVSSNITLFLDVFCKCLMFALKSLAIVLNFSVCSGLFRLMLFLMNIFETINVAAFSFMDLRFSFNIYILYFLFEKKTRKAILLEKKNNSTYFTKWLFTFTNG